VSDGRCGCLTLHESKNDIRRCRDNTTLMSLLWVAE
jgi:hypothetical protein